MFFVVIIIVVVSFIKYKENETNIHKERREKKINI